MNSVGHDSLKTRRTLVVAGKPFEYFSLKAAQQAGLGEFSRLPFSMKVLVENLLRFEDGDTVKIADIEAFGHWLETQHSSHEIAYRPTRVLMQDFTGVPAVVDLAAMREAVARSGADSNRINPLSRVDLVIDHSVMVDSFGNNAALEKNVSQEMARNQERYAFLRWGQQAFENFNVVPPGTGICHQVNLEYLAKAVWSSECGGQSFAYPDTLVGTDSHTTMINALGVLGWGVGGIEAEASMLGQPISMLIPDVVGFKLTGRLAEGIMAMDLVLHIVQMLRAHGVVAKFVEFYGPGLNNLPLADRATIANMAPEYGATCGFFPIDQETINYLKLSGRSDETVALVEAYCKAQGMWRGQDTADPVFSSSLELDISSVMPSLAGPKRPQDRVAMTELKQAFDDTLELLGKGDEKQLAIQAGNENYQLHHGDVVIAAITSCTNTSNPTVLMAAGLLAKNALAKGLSCKPWVKTSLAPGSKVVTEYLDKANLSQSLDQLGFNTVGYGCTTCIGNSGPLPEAVAAAIEQGDLVVSSVLSGNRNFEGRVHQMVKANWLASPPLVVAYAIAGTTRINLAQDPLGEDQHGKPVYLKDIWPSNQEVSNQVMKINHHMFRRQYASVFAGDAQWQSIAVEASPTYAWQENSTYIRHPSFFDNLQNGAGDLQDIHNARILALFGDSVTTDHISPAGAIKADSPAGHYLTANGVAEKDFNSYGSRRGNHEVMMRGTFANIRIRNEMLSGVEGGYTRYVSGKKNGKVKGQQMAIYDAAMAYGKQGTPLVIVAGKEYGTGSSRDWAAKGTLLLGVKVVICESFERIHRSNLIGMGVLPLQFKTGDTRQSIGLNGSESIDILGLADDLQPSQDVTAVIRRSDGSSQTLVLLCRIDTANEVQYYQHGGILQYVLSNMMAD